MNVITLADIRKAVLFMEKESVKPKTVKTTKEAKEMIAFDNLLGLESKWKVGDEYYEMVANPELKNLLSLN